MSYTVALNYKGLDIPAALITVQSCSVQGSQLDFFVSMRAGEGLPMIDGQTHGCAYDPSAGTPEEQAYAYLATLDNPLEVPVVEVDTPRR